MKYSINDFLILEPYKHGQGLRSHVQHGFATVEQKTNIVPLKLLVAAKLKDGTNIPAGTSVFISEELLSNSPWAKSLRKGLGLGDQQFIVVELRYITGFDMTESAQ